MHNRPTQVVLFWFGNLMAVAFLCCGFVFLLTDVLIDNFPYPNRKWLGVLLLVYAGYRGMRQFSQFKKLQRTDEK